MRFACTTFYSARIHSWQPNIKLSDYNNNQENVGPPNIKSYRFKKAVAFKEKLPQQLIHHSAIRYSWEMFKDVASSHSDCHAATITHECSSVNMDWGSTKKYCRIICLDQNHYSFILFQHITIENKNQTLLITL